VRTAVVGASGYSGQELLRYLARHPAFQVVAITSRQQAGERLDQSLAGLPAKMGELVFTDAAPGPELAALADLFFLALPHGTAAPYAVALRKAGKRVVDLSADFRLKDPALYEEFYGAPHPAPELLNEAVYGLPEIHRDALASAQLVAAPGCFPTSILLPLMPFTHLRWLDDSSISISSLSGVSGAGRKLENRLLFGEISDNMYAYGAPKHRHLSEIEEQLSIDTAHQITVSFVPHLVPLHRGMVTTITAKLAGPHGEKEALEVLESEYHDEPFVEIVAPPAFPEARDVLHSNRIRIGVRVDSRTGRLLLFSAIDNLGKGAAAQAIQAANIACGVEESAGLAG
jgi:N-acetyl-gamma-glutamyl-phosphate reductase